jgi:hypothetical protein
MKKGARLAIDGHEYEVTDVTVKTIKTERKRNYAGDVLAYVTAGRYIGVGEPTGTAGDPYARQPPRAWVHRWATGDYMTHTADCAPNCMNPAHTGEKVDVIDVAPVPSAAVCAWPACGHPQAVHYDGYGCMECGRPDSTDEQRANEVHRFTLMSREPKLIGDAE